MATTDAAQLSAKRVREFWIQVFQNGNFTMLDEGFIADGYTFNGTPQTTEDVRGFAEAFCKAYDQRKVEIHRDFGADDKVGIWWNLSAVHVGTNKLYTTSAMNIITVKNKQAFRNEQVGSLTLDGS